MRVATCTPVDFAADAQFFGRDSGLLCRGFQAAGHDAFVVMPGPDRAGDEPGVVRCMPEELASSAWWRSLEVELVVLYAWGDPRYRPIAEAIREAGISLIQSLDTAGLTTPYGNIREWWLSLTGMLSAESGIGGKLRLVAKAVRDLIPAAYEKKRLSMIDCSDRIAVVSPPASASVAAYAKALGFPGVAGKLMVAPHPVSPLMTCPSEEKASKVLVVGRWLDEDCGQKDPELTMAVLGKFLEAFPAWTAEVVGRGSTALQIMTNRWSDDAASRLTLTEAVPRIELIGRYRQSRILLCCSRHESFHISSAEALCCGCSVVVADHPLLASTGWFTTKDSGTLSPTRIANDVVTTLASEAGAWEQSRRNPQHIARAWQDLLHADRVAEGILATSNRRM